MAFAAWWATWFSHGQYFATLDPWSNSTNQSEEVEIKNCCQITNMQSVLLPHFTLPSLLLLTYVFIYPVMWVPLQRGAKKLGIFGTSGSNGERVLQTLSTESWSCMELDVGCSCQMKCGCNLTTGILQFTSSSEWLHKHINDKDVTLCDSTPFFYWILKEYIASVFKKCDNTVMGPDQSRSFMYVWQINGQCNLTLVFACRAF